LIEKAKPDKSQAGVLREQSSNGPKGRARGAVAAGLSRVHAL
jgi:hypothetical protein